MNERNYFVVWATMNDCEVTFERYSDSLCSAEKFYGSKALRLRRTGNDENRLMKEVDRCVPWSEHWAEHEHVSGTWAHWKRGKRGGAGRVEKSGEPWAEQSVEQSRKKKRAQWGAPTFAVWYKLNRFHLIFVAKQEKKAVRWRSFRFDVCRRSLQVKPESPAVADKPARRLRKVCTVYVRALGLL